MMIPDGFAGVTPYIFVKNAPDYVGFLERGLGAVELGRSLSSGGRIANCQLRISGATIMVSEASASFPASRAAFYLFVADADEAMRIATRSGATTVMAVDDMPYGDRQGGVRDPAGNIWWISQRLVKEPYF